MVWFQGFGLSEGDELEVVALTCVEQQLIAKAACVMKIVRVDERDGRRRFKGHCCNIVSEVEELVGDMADCLPRTQHQAKLKVLRPRTATPKLMELRKRAIVAMLVLLRQRHPLYAHVTGNKEAYDALPGGGWLGVDDLAADQVLDPPRVSAVDPGGGSGGSGVPHAVPMSADRGLQEEQERQDREVLTESGLSSSGAATDVHSLLSPARLPPPSCA